MKSTVILCVLALVTLTLAGVMIDKPYNGCVNVLGKCIRKCEEGTYAYAVDCDHITPEPTCDQPDPVAEEAIICDHSSCYCNPPTVRDLVTGKCVLREECSKNE